MAKLPGTNASGGTAPVTAPDTTPKPVPAIWDDPQRVIAVVLDMYDEDPDAATALWNEYRKLKYGL